MLRIRSRLAGLAGHLPVANLAPLARRIHSSPSSQSPASSPATSSSSSSSLNYLDPTSPDFIKQLSTTLPNDIFNESRQSYMKKTPFIRFPFLPKQPTPTNPETMPATLSAAIKSSSLVFPQWTSRSRRCGAIAIKLGMTAVWDHWGNQIPITVVKLDFNQVVQVKSQKHKKGYVGMQVGCGIRSFKSAPKSLIVHCLKYGVLPKAKIVEFPVTVDAVLPPGTQITARHFVAGQFLDVTGITRGKGTQGGMFRWGFGGQPASHGVSITHRSVGSTGSNQTPGRVFKGKKMPGHMGVEKRTVMNIKLYKIDVKRQLLYLQGAVPGPKRGFLVLRDARKKRWHRGAPPPFPTYFPKKDVPEPDEIIMPVEGSDPNAELAGL